MSLNFDKIVNGRQTREERERANQDTQKIIDDVRAGRTSSVSVNDEYINSFARDASSFLSASSSIYKNNTYKNSKNNLDYIRRRREELNRRSQTIRSYLGANKSRLDANTYASISKMLDDYDKGSQDVVSVFDDADYYFDKNLDAIKSREEMESFDTDKGRMDLDSLEKRLEAASTARANIVDLQQLTDDYESLPEYQENKKILDEALAGEYKDYDDLRGRVNADRAYLNQAEYLQKGIKLASDAITAEDFAEFAKKGSEIANPTYREANGGANILGWRPFGEDVANEVAFSRGNRGEVVADALTRTNPVGNMLYFQMTDEEVDIYNYYLAKEGEEKANEYLRSIEQSLEQREAEMIYDETLKDKPFAERLFSLTAGFDQFASGMKGLGSMISGEDEYVPTSSVQLAGGMAREDLADAGFKIGDTSTAQIAYDIGSTSANMLPSILTSVAVSTALPALGASNLATGVASAVTGSVTLGASATGNAYAEMINLGYDRGQAAAYATLVGASEAMLSYALSGITAVGGKLTQNVVSKVLNSVDNAFARVAIKLGGNMLSEFTEEALQEILSPVFKNVMLGEKNEIVWSDVLYSGILGALTAPIFEGGDVAKETVSNVRTGAGIKKLDAGVQRLKDLGTTFAADTVAYQLADRVNENTDAYTIGRLFSEIGAEMSAQNAADIKRELEKRGMLPDDAETSTDIVGRVISNQQLTPKQIETLRSNDVVADAVRTVLFDENNVAVQRSDTLAQLASDVARERQAQKEQRVAARADKRAAKTGQKPQETAPQSTTAAAAEEVVERDAEPEEEPLNVSLSGKTLDERTGKEIAIKEISNIKTKKDGKRADITFKLDDGSTISAGDVAYSSETEGALYSGIADMNVNAGVANAMVRAFKTASVPVETFLKGAGEAFQYGQYNYSMERGVFSKDLTEYQRRVIYRLGQVYSSQEITRREAEIKAAIKKNKTGERKEGSVHFENKGKHSLTKKQQATIKVMEFLSKVTGFDFYVFESHKTAKGVRVYTDENGVVKKAPNGWFDPKDSSIHIDLFAGNKGTGDIMLFTLAHEITHAIKNESPAQFKELADFLVEQLGTDDMERLVARQIRKAMANNRTISYDEAFEEVVADSMETMLASGNVVEVLSELKSRNESLWDKIKSIVEKLLKEIKSLLKAYKNADPSSVEGYLVSRLKENADVYERLERLFAESVYKAGENYQRSSVTFDADSQSAAPMRSLRTWTESEYVQMRADTAKKLSKDLGVSLAQAYKYIDDINGVAALIADDVVRLDYEPNLDDTATVLKPNSDYKYSIDMSTLCAKRLLATGTFNEIQRRLPNVVFSSEAMVALREMMQQRGYEVACGICYVESTRRDMGRITQDFIDQYKRSQETGKPIQRLNSSGKLKDLVKTKDGMKTTADKSTDRFYADKDYTPTLADLNTTDIDFVKRDHPLVYEAYLNFMNARGQSKPKLLETRAEYKGEILKVFKQKKTVDARNALGGLRLQSFSDFEVPHMIDMMQVVMDMSRVGLKSQAYTKVPAFARVFGNTGVKINLSLIAKGSGLDANGNLIFDDVEGMNHKEAFAIRDKFSKNVGTILVGKNDAHIIAAMADPRIDYVIPFHKSSWKESLYEALGLTGYDDYTDTQHEKYIDKSRGTAKDFDPSEYWDETKSGDENAQIYLQKCRADGRIPKFPQFQGYPGYWKLLIDFKMYDNDGNYAPQEVVRPQFEMGAAQKILKDYEGDHRSLPVAKDVVEDFIKEYEENGKVKDTSSDIAVLYSDRDVLSWNIDWDKDNNSTIKSQMVRHADEINVMEPVATIDFDKSDGKTYAEILDENLRTRFGYKIERTDGASFLFDKVAIASLRRYVKSDEEAAAVISAPYVLKRGKAISGHKNHKNLGNPSVTYAGGVIINGERVNVGVAVLFGAKNRPHSLRVLMPSGKEYVLRKIKTDPKRKGASPAGDVRSSTGSAYKENLAQNSNPVKPSLRDTTPADTFYSHMGRVIDGIKPAKMGAGGVISYLKGKGVKNEEIKWSGIEEFLKGKKSVSKEELQEFAKASMLQIEESTLERKTDGKIKDWQTGLTYDSLEDWKFSAMVDADSYGHTPDEVEFRTERNGNVNLVDKKSKKVIASGFARVVDETKWSQYSLKGGSNYRELLFKLPGSDYSNAAMQAHWGSGAQGVLAHARVQDFEMGLDKVLFVEEIQSDWHNQGNKEGYRENGARDKEAIAREMRDYLKRYFESDAAKSIIEKISLVGYEGAGASMILNYLIDEETTKSTLDMLSRKGVVFSETDKSRLDGYVNGYAELFREWKNAPGVDAPPDAPFRDYHEFVMKRLIREAAEKGYDSIAWTTADIQSDRWSDQYAEGYRIEYDQDIPKFMNKFGKKWGVKVGKVEVPTKGKNGFVVDGKEYKSYADALNAVVREANNMFGYVGSDRITAAETKVKQDNGTTVVYDSLGVELGRIEMAPSAIEVWSMPITDEMRESVMTEGLPLYQERESGDMSARDLLANALDSVAQTNTEKATLAEYKRKVGQLNEQEAEVKELDGQISAAVKAKDFQAAKALRLKRRRAVNRINTLDKSLLTLQATKPLKDVLARERKASYAKAMRRADVELKKLREEKNARIREVAKEAAQQHKESRARAAMNRERTEMRHKIRKSIRRLDKLLNRGNKQRNVKQGMQEFVRSAIATAEVFFTDTLTNADLLRNGVGVEMTEAETEHMNKALQAMAILDKTDANNQEEREKVQNALTYRMSQLREVFVRERTRLNKATADMALDKLAQEYLDIKDSDEAYIRAAYDDVTYEHLVWLKHKVRGAVIRDMTFAQLKSVYEAYRMVETKVSQANKAFTTERNIDEMSNALIREVSGRRRPKSKAGVVVRNVLNKIGWNYEKPYYALDRAGSETLKALYGALFSSEDIVMRDVIEAAEFRDSVVEKYGFNDWPVNKKIDKVFTDTTGREFQVTLGELMALYAYSRREGAWNHIEYGGFVFGQSALTDENPADAYKLSREKVDELIGNLTASQKRFAEEMQTYLSDVMGAKGNEVSMKLYGIEMFGEKNYFPIHIAGQYMARANESQAKAAAGFSTMTNAGFTKAQNMRATAPFVLESFMDVWSDHVNEMSRYHGTVPALEDIRRVMNYSVYFSNEANSTSAKAALENAYGKEAVEYFDALYREANSGAITDKLQKTSHKLLSKFRKNSVAYSLSVLVQQPASLNRAFAMIPKKYFGINLGITGVGALPIGIGKAITSKWTKAHGRAYAEMLKYAPGVTLAKEIGGFDTASGSSIRTYLMDTKKTLRQKLKTEPGKGKASAVMNLVDDNVVANLPNLADKIAWIEIWNACKRETAAKVKSLTPGSEAFYNRAGARFTEVIRATQVYDSIFSKSPLLKSKNLAVQYLVSFMNEPNTTSNMTESAVRDLRNKNILGAARKVSAVVRSVVMTCILKSLIYALRDEDEDQSYIEKYIESLSGSLLDDATVFNYIPVVRDVWSMVQGYDVERPDMAILSDAISSLVNVANNLGKDTSDMTEEELIEWDKKVTEANWKLVDSIAAFFGIPVKNVRREIDAVIDTAKSSYEGKTSWSGIADALEQSIVDAAPAFAKPDQASSTDKLYEAIVSGDTEYRKRLESQYKDEKALNNAIRKGLRENDPRVKEAAEARFNGDIGQYKKLAKAIMKDGFSLDNVVSAINSELNKLGDDGEETASKEKRLFKAQDFLSAVLDRDTSTASDVKEDMIDKYMDDGKTAEAAEKAFASAVQSDARERFEAGEITEQTAATILEEHCGKDAEEAAQIASEWAFKKARGYAWDDKEDAYKSGELSADQLRKDLVEIGGKTEEEADEQIAVYDFEMEVPGSEVNYSDVEDYETYCKPAGISKSVFYDALVKYKETPGKYDENGDSIPYSKTQKVMPIIDSLPISSAQKTALARCWWAESTVRKYKTW